MKIEYIDVREREWLVALLEQEIARVQLRILHHDNVNTVHRLKMLVTLRDKVQAADPRVH